MSRGGRGEKGGAGLGKGVTRFTVHFLSPEKTKTKKKKKRGGVWSCDEKPSVSEKKEQKERRKEERGGGEGDGSKISPYFVINELNFLSCLSPSQYGTHCALGVEEGTDLPVW